MARKTTGSGYPPTRAKRGGYARLALIIGTALASHLIASTALLSNETPAPTTHLVPLFPEGHDGSGKEGLIRVVNYSMEQGTVRIAAFDDGGRRHPPFATPIGAGQAVHLDSHGPVLVADHFVETTKGNPDGVVVAVVDGQGFDRGTHGERITETFLDHTGHAALVQIDGWGEYELNGHSLLGTNIAGYVRHVLTRGGGIFWTSSDVSLTYWPGEPGWFVENGRPFPENVREFVNWMRDQDVLFISSLENATSARAPEGVGYVPVYCDDFELNDEGWWIPLCGTVDDYVAHSGVGLDTVLFVGALDGNYASGAIRADGVFAPHAIYVESPDGSTSHATPVLAAYATNLSFANPSWGAARLKRELMALARDETVDYITGGANEFGTIVTEPRTVKVIRPPGPAADPPVGGANRPPSAIGTLPSRRLTPRSTQVVDVSQAFADPDGDALTYAASSSAPSVVTARTAGARVTLTAVSEGSSTIEVTATDPGGLSAAHSLAVTVSTSWPFADDPIRPGVTPVRAVHFTELRSRIDSARQAASLLPYGWTDPVLVAGVTPVRLVHLLELRTALERAYAAAGRSAPRWSDPTPAAATVIRAVHLTELRAAVVALE